MKRIGQLRHRLFLEAPVDTPDGAGGNNRSWSPVAAMWGAIRPRRGNEDLIAGSLRAEVTHKIVIRHRTDVDANMRFALGTRRFRIVSIADMDGRAARLVCDVIEELET